MATKAKLESVTGKLNVVLRPEDLTAILRKTLGTTGGRASAMIVSRHCCVDVSVGSSVAGPVSTVASSISVVEPRAAARKAPLKTKVSSDMVKVKIPRGLKVK